MFPSKLYKGSCITAFLSSSNNHTIHQSIHTIFKKFAEATRISPKPPLLAPDRILQRSVRTIYKTFAKPSRTSRPPTKMSTCPRCERELVLPPSAYYLNARFQIKPNTSIDRSLRRCPHCDELRARNLAVEAELPPPTVTNPVTKTRGTIKKLEELIADNGLDAEEMQLLHEVLWSLRRKLTALLRATDESIRNAWMTYWSIWGIKEGQEEMAAGI
jgi:hypothetical protein